MAVERVLGTENNPDIIESGSAVEIIPEQSRSEAISESDNILVMDDEVLLDEQIAAELANMENETEDFFDNLAEFVDENELSKLASNLIDSIHGDLESRSEWEKTYTDGLKYLGMKFDDSRSQPFQGSSGVIHPILAEATTQFQAQAYKELLPAKGPVKTQILGARTVQTESQAERVQEFMNYYIMNVMEDYDPELDQLLFYLPLAGSCFKKIYFDFVLQRAVSKFIPPEDLIVPYEAPDMSSAERITHAITMSRNEIKKQQLSGFYIDVDIPEESYESRDEITSEIDEIEGTKPSYTEDRNRTIYEVHTILDLEGFEDVDDMGEPTGLKLPYIVTIDEQSNQILAIRRNYNPNDPTKNKINYFVQYKFLPGLGS